MGEESQWGLGKGWQVSGQNLTGTVATPSEESSFINPTLAGEMAEWVEVLAEPARWPEFKTLETMLKWKGRTDPTNLSFDLHTCAMATPIHHIHTQTHNYNIYF